MAISCRLLIDRILELVTFDDAVWGKVESLLDDAGDVTVGHGDFGRAIGVDVDAHRLGTTDGIAELHQHLVADACRHHVLGDVACRVCSGTVHLGGILAGEGSATVRPATPVGVHDDLAASQTSVAVRSPDDESARRVDI